MDQYKKQYQIHDFFDKFSTFKSNLDLIVAHNAKNLPWKMAVNEFADLSAEQFTSKMLGLNVNLGQEYAMSLLQAPVLGPRRHGSRQVPGEKAEYPTINWIEKGVVNEVKNQMSCGMFYFHSSNIIFIFLLLLFFIIIIVIFFIIITIFCTLTTPLCSNSFSLINLQNTQQTKKTHQHQQ